MKAMPDHGPGKAAHSESRRATAGSSGRRRIVWAVALARAGMAAAAVFYRQGWLHPGGGGAGGRRADGSSPSQTFTLLNASGYVVADRKSAVASKLTGRLVYLGVEEGSRVQRGRDHRAAGEPGRGRRARARGPERPGGAATTSSRRRPSWRTPPWTTSASERSSSGAPSRARPSTRPRRASAPRAAAVEALTAAAARGPGGPARRRSVQLDYANIRAPFDAVVLTKNADVGDIVTPLAATADAKAAVVTVADMGSLHRGGGRVRVEHRPGAGRPALRDPPGRLPGRPLPRPRAHDPAHGRPQPRPRSP
ncbi:MAG: hypothetical protein MZV70_50180 [Desulfobacterales bacterium]|nr:hypothetical protein [Desulfobacterales bacterium]